jgi:ferrochelatase
VAAAIGVVLAPHYSELSVGRYASVAHEAADAKGMDLQVLESWYQASGFAELHAERVRKALATLPPGAQFDPQLLFSAHSLPLSTIEKGDPYADQVKASARAAAEASGVGRWSVCWQSAAPGTGQPWLQPDVREAISEAGESGATGVVVCPIGFVTEHLEVLYDLDVDAHAAADAAGIPFARAATLDDDPRFCALLANTVAMAADAVV